MPPLAFTSFGTSGCDHPSRIEFGKKLFDEPAGDSLNNLPRSVIYSWHRLVLVCFHARRVYGETGKTTFAFQKQQAEFSPRLRVRLFTQRLWDGSAIFGVLEQECREITGSPDSLGTDPDDVLAGVCASIDGVLCQHWADQWNAADETRGKNGEREGQKEDGHNRQSAHCRI